jgi:hypothetical protein
MQCLEPGSVPASIAVTVQDELADCCQPGGETWVTSRRFRCFRCQPDASSPRGLTSGKQDGVVVVAPPL